MFSELAKSAVQFDYFHTAIVALLDLLVKWYHKYKMIFHSNKYSRWYNQIIERAKCRLLNGEYKEIHHIMPKCLGGNNDSSNLVELTAREHFVVHWLLTKMVDGTVIIAKQLKEN